MTIQEAAKANETQAVRCLALKEVTYDVGMMSNEQFPIGEIIASWEVVMPRSSVTVEEAMLIIGREWPNSEKEVYEQVHRQLKYGVVG